MRYADLKLNDTANAPGVCVSFFTQGCPHQCPHCFNPETWDYDGGKEFTYDILLDIISALKANGVHRDLCILGGEPLCPENLLLVDLIIQEVKQKCPDVKIYIWSGYTYFQLKKRRTTEKRLDEILAAADVLIDGPYLHSLRNINLKMRGSSNQRIYDLKLDEEIKL